MELLVLVFGVTIGFIAVINRSILKTDQRKVFQRATRNRKVYIND